MRKFVLKVLAIAALIVPAISQASLLNFYLTDGSNNIRFDMDSNPAVTNVASQKFDVVPVQYSVNGAANTTGSVRFFDTAGGGGLEIGTDLSTLAATRLVSQFGAQVFSGVVSSPVFAPGVFSFVDFSAQSQTFDSAFRLTISVPASVPVPGSLALMGLGLAGLALKRRNSAG